jgi:hypothetical protein
MLVAFLLVSLVRWILFYPRKEILINGKKLPLTPGLIVKYHKLLMSKFNGLLNDFLHDIESDHGDNKITDWEEKCFEKCYKWAEHKINIKYLPNKLLIGLRVLMAEFGREFVHQFARSFVPYLMERMDVSRYVDMVNHNINLELLQKYYDRYIYKYSLIIMCGFALMMTLDVALG